MNVSTNVESKARKYRLSWTEFVAALTALLVMTANHFMWLPVQIEAAHG